MSAIRPSWTYRGAHGPVAWLVAVACLMAVAACGSKPAASVPASSAPPAPPPLATSFTGAAGAGWAVVEMGGSAAQENNFWQMFSGRPGDWRLATPLGVADNGGLVVTDTGAGSLVTGFVPSQDLTFSPLAASADDGANWSPGDPVTPGLAGVPDALAAGPGARLIALTRSGAEIDQHLGAWTRLSSAGALAATPAGRACRVTRLTAAAFSSAGAPLLAASCGRPGVAGIFAEAGGRWQAAGPAVPASMAGQDVEVLRLTATGAGLVALLQAGAGPGASLAAAWSDNSGTHWSLSAPLRMDAGRLRSTAVGPGGSIGIILNVGHGETLAGPGSSWRSVPALPQWAATLAPGPAGRLDVIAAHGGTFSDWRLAGSRWSPAQTIRVTIPYGSSG